MRLIVFACAARKKAMFGERDSPVTNLLGAMFAHEFQKEERFVHVAPVFFRVLQAPSYHTHDLLVVIYVIRSLGDLCKAETQGEP